MLLSNVTITELNGFELEIMQAFATALSVDDVDDILSLNFVSNGNHVNANFDVKQTNKMEDTELLYNLFYDQLARVPDLNMVLELGKECCFI